MGNEFNRARVAAEIKIGDKEGVLSVVLIGSFARGEELWSESDGHRRLLSDVEAMVVVEEEKLLDRNWRKDLEAELKRILPIGVIGEVTGPGAGVFEVCVGFTTKRHLRLLKEAGLVHIGTTKQGTLLTQKGGEFLDYLTASQMASTPAGEQ